jgi:uncharacterized membrane protein
LIPYAVFNLGIVYELAKMENVGFIDVPYSIALSGHRVDVSTVYDEEDVVAIDWLKANIDDESIIYSDTHGVRLLIQKFGVLMNADGTLKAGRIRPFEYYQGSGYIFLRKLNVDRDIITVQGEYGSRLSYPINDELQSVIDNGQVVFDNGARIIKVVE